jgi:bifunctional non-homologous end joining protein LigD
MWAFDLIELEGEDMRRETLELRRAALDVLLGRQSGPGIRFNEHMQKDGPIVFKHACRLGFEGIVSKRKDSHYVSGRCRDWIKSKNPNAPAVKREAIGADDLLTMSAHRGEAVISVAMR